MTSLAIDLTAQRALKLKHLQRTHPSVLEIIEDCMHVAVYTFKIDENKWTRMEVEGAMYIIRNNQKPFYTLLVLNKIGENDFLLHIENIKKAKVQDQYIMLQCVNQTSHGAEKAIFGIWFHNDSERAKFFESINKTMERTSNKDGLGMVLNKLVLKESNSLNNNIENVNIPNNSINNSNEAQNIDSNLLNVQTSPSFNKSRKLLALLRNTSGSESTNNNNKTDSNTANDTSNTTESVATANTANNLADGASNAVGNVSAVNVSATSAFSENKSVKLLSLLRSKSADVNALPRADENASKNGESAITRAHTVASTSNKLVVAEQSANWFELLTDQQIAEKNKKSAPTTTASKSNASTSSTTAKLQSNSPSLSSLSLKQTSAQHTSAAETASKNAVITASAKRPSIGGQGSTKAKLISLADLENM